MGGAANKRPSSLSAVLTPISFQMLGVIVVLMILETSIELNTAS